MNKPPACQIKNLTIGSGHPLALIAGPCVIESRELIMRTAEKVQAVAKSFGVPVIFKSSYRKANRTSAKGFRGIGDEEGLSILAEVKAELGLPVLTDIHSEPEAVAAAEVADVLQIPAFLCRQTELLEAAGKTGRAVNIKKGQFAAPVDMKFAAEKVTNVGNHNVLLTERGTTFGYHDLVVDMRSLKVMRDLGFPVVFDATHAVQLPSKDGGEGSSGLPEFILPLARAGVAAGCDAIFVEVHPDPLNAMSDRASQLHLEKLAPLLSQLTRIASVVREMKEGMT